MNRKLIRPTLAEIKEKGRDAPKEQNNGEVIAPATAPRGSAGSTNNSGGSSTSGAASSHQQRPPASSHSQTSGGAAGASASSQLSQQNRSKRVPPAETYAEIFYYKKQMDAHTPMIIVLQDGEEIEGTIEWYDREALKVNRRSAPNILLLKHNIKYMYKADERESK